LIKILHVIPSVSPTEGGPSVAVKAIAAELNCRGCSVDVATTNDGGRGSYLDVPLGREVVEAGVRYFFFRKQVHLYKVSLPLARWLATNIPQYDVIHVHALFSFASVAAGRAAAASRVPYVVRPLGVLNKWGVENRRAALKRISLKLVELPMLRRAAALHFTSEAERQEAISICADISAVRSAVIPLPIPQVESGSAADFVAKFRQAKNRRIVLFLSRIDPKKGIELLLESFADVHRTYADSLLVIAGVGDALYTATLERIASELGIADHVVWTGHITGPIKAAAFAAASCFVLPSHSENFGIAAAEALAAGTPTIVSPGVAISAEINAYDAGIVTGRGRTEVAGAIVRLLDDCTLAERVKQGGRRLVRERYSPEAVGAALLQLYADVVASRQRASTVST
jgi:glycosyltransferase involved in cell wall biosynthesis